jgi:hypothetical protein
MEKGREREREREREKGRGSAKGIKINAVRSSRECPKYDVI